MISHIFISLMMVQKKKKQLNTENAIHGHMLQTIMYRACY